MISLSPIIIVGVRAGFDRDIDKLEDRETMACQSNELCWQGGLIAMFCDALFGPTLHSLESSSAPSTSIQGEPSWRMVYLQSVTQQFTATWLNNILPFS